jgi:pimeloyl-ACP methyl ester carboxylesterase
MRAALAKATKRSDASRPVLLLHGFASSPRVLAPLERHLRRALGREVVRMRLSAGRQDLRASAHEVQRLLERLARSDAFEYADVVGHSMGGLIAAYLLKKLDRGQPRLRPRAVSTTCGSLARPTRASCSSARSSDSSALRSRRRGAVSPLGARVPSAT